MEIGEFPIVPTFFNGEQTQEIRCHLGTQKGANLCMHQNTFGHRAVPGPAGRA